MNKKIGFVLILIFTVLGSQAQSSDKSDEWLGDVKGGIRIQKTQKLYYENGFTFDFTSPKVVNNRIHLGVSYVSTRLGSAVGNNAIKQDNFLLSLGYSFRDQKKLQPFTRINTGYFTADYESDIFDGLTNDAYILSIDAGLSYELNVPVTINLSAGYNLNTGNGLDGPGTLHPVFYQMSVYYTFCKKN